MTIHSLSQEPVALAQGFVRVRSLQYAFDFFRPNIDYQSPAESGSPGIRIGSEFRSLDDFDPAHMQEYRRTTEKENYEYRRNDLADQRSSIDALAGLLSAWQSDDVRKLWINTARRKEITTALAEIRGDLERATLCARTIRQLLENVPGMISQQCDALMLLASLSTPLAEGDTHDETVQKIQKQVDQRAGSQGDLLRQIFERIRPIERSYRLLDLFFQNAAAAEGDLRRTELYVLDADMQTISTPFSSVLEEIERFIRGRNQNLVATDDVSNLVAPGFLAPWLRTRLEEIASGSCALLISDADAENSVSRFEMQCKVGAKYEFLRLPNENASSHILAAGRVRLRPDHWFEEESREGGLYGNASLVLVGALARSRITGGADNERLKWPLAGCEKSRPEFTSGCLDHLRFEQQVICVIRRPGGLEFEAGGPAGNAPEGILRSFLVRRVEFFLRVYLASHLNRLSGFVLTREFMEENIEAPLEHVMNGLVEQGMAAAYRLDVDKGVEKRAQGTCDITITVRLPGTEESFTIKPDVPQFQHIQAASGDLRRVVVYNSRR